MGNATVEGLGTLSPAQALVHSLGTGEEELPLLHHPDAVVHGERAASGSLADLLNSTLAITPHSKPRRLAALRTPAGLLPCRSLQATREKSPPRAPTTVCAPALDECCKVFMPTGP